MIFQIKKINYIFTSILFLQIFIFAKIMPQTNVPTVQLKILDATYQVPDTHIRSGTNIILTNKASKKTLESTYKKKDETDVNYWVKISNKISSAKEIEDTKQKKIGSKKKIKEKRKQRIEQRIDKAHDTLTPDFIFTIEKVDGKKGEIIKPGDFVVLKSVADFAKNNPYLGLKKGTVLIPAGFPIMPGVIAPVPVPIKKWLTHLDSKKIDPKCQWIVEGNLNDGGIISLKSKDQDKYLYDPILPDKRAALMKKKAPGPRTQFYINIILPKEVGEFNIGTPLNQKFISKETKGINLVNFLNGEIKNKSGLKTIEDGINLEGDFNQILGDLGLSGPYTKVFKQLTVTYQLANNIYKQIIPEVTKKIQIPTLEQLQLAQQQTSAKLEAEKDLKEIGLKKELGTLSKISTNVGISYGLNFEGKLFWWNNQTFKEINTNNLRFKDLAIGSDGILLLIDTNDKLYLKNNNQFTQVTQNNFIDISLANQNNVWCLLQNGNINKIDLKTGQLTPVGKKTFLQISVGSDGSVFAIDNQYNVYQWLGGNNYQNDENWIPIPGQNLKQISVGNINEVWGIDVNNRKVFKLNKNTWQEVGPARSIAYISIGGSGEMWALVPQIPPIQNQLLIYHKTKNSIAFQTPITLKAFSNKYLTEEDNIIKASTNWPDEWIFINPKNPQLRNPIKFGNKVIIKNLATNNYIKAIEQEDQIFFTSQSKTATIFEILNHQDSNEIREIPSNSLIDLKTAKGYLSVASKEDGNLLFNPQRGIRTKWTIDSAK